MNQINLNTPLWDLSEIFPSINSKEYKTSLETYQKLLSNTQKHLSSATDDFSSWLKSSIDFFNQLSYWSKTFNAYAYLIYSVDTTNTEYLNNISLIDDLLIQQNQLSLQFQKILKSKESELKPFFSSNPDFRDYEYIIFEELNEINHQMAPELEKLASELQQTGGDAWDRLHEQLISNLKDSQTGKTFNELRNDAYSSDPEIRFQSYQKELSLLQQNEIAFAACLSNLKGETLTLNGHRNYQKAIDRALASGRMSKKTLQALISAIEKSLPSWQKYFKAKGNYLKKNNLTVSKDTSEGIAFYDLFAPVSTSSDSDSLFSRTWTFDQAMDYVISKYDSFSKDMGNFARKAREQHWIDAKVRSGKVGGAYDEDIPLLHQSRVMTNFTGAFSDVITLAHELGHAYHFYCMKEKPALFYDYPMTLAETASTFAETLVKQELINSSTGFDRFQALELDLQDVSQVLVDILCRYYFELSVFEKRGEGELNAEDFSNLMKDAQQKSYGEGLNSQRHQYMWAVKSHYYSTGLDFYNFPYAFGQLFAASLYAQYKVQGQSFSQDYKNLLSNTGNLSCEELCKKMIMDIESEEFWTQAISIYTKEIEDFMEFAK